MFYMKNKYKLLVLIISISCIAGVGISYLQFDYSPEKMINARDYQRTYHDYLSTFGSDENTIVIIVSGVDRLFYTTELSEKLNTVAGIEAQTLFSFISVKLKDNLNWQTINYEIEKKKYLKRTFISEDNSLLSVVVSIDNDKVLTTEDLKQTISKIKQKITLLAHSHEVEVAINGIPYIRYQIIKKLIAEQLFFTPLSIIIFLLVLWLLFRNLSLGLLPLVSVTFSVLWTLGVMGWCGVAIDIISNILPTLIFVIGTADGVHIISHYLKERQTQSNELAIMIAIRKNFTPCLFTSITTAIGFGSLILVGAPILQNFGLFAALGVIMSFFSSMIIIPLGLLTLKNIPQKNRFPQLENPLSSLAISKPFIIIGLSLLLILYFVYLSYHVKVDNRLFEVVVSDDPIAVANEIQENKMCGIIPVAIYLELEDENLIRQPLFWKKIYELSNFTKQQHGINYVTSGAELIQQAYLQMPFSKKVFPDNHSEILFCLTAIKKYAQVTWSSLVNEQNLRVQIKMFCNDIGAYEFQKLKKTLEEKIFQLKINCKAHITGTGSLGYLASYNVISDLLDSLLLSFTVIFITLIFLFRSWRISLLCTLPNLLPLICLYGALNLMELSLQTTTVFIFPIALGLVVDDTIHFIMNYQYFEEEGYSGNKALLLTIQTSGKAITITSLIFVAGFFCLAFSSLPITKHFSILMQITIATAFWGDLVLLPAILVVFNRRQEVIQNDK